MVKAPHHTDFTGRRAAVQYNYQAGKVIRAARMAQGKSVIVLSNLIGLSNATLSALERGETDVKAYHLLRIAEALGISPTTLFRDTYK